MTAFDSPEFRDAVAAVMQPALDRMADKIASQAVSRAQLDDVLSRLTDQINEANAQLHGMLTDLRANGVDIKLTAAPPAPEAPSGWRVSKTVKQVGYDDEGKISTIVEYPVEMVEDDAS